MTAGAAPAAPLTTRAIVALSFAAFGAAASMRVNDSLLPRFEAEFGVSLANAANVITAFAIAYGAFQALFGPAGDRFGKYRVVGVATLASGATALACALMPDFEALVVARFFAGATAAAIIPLSMAWIGDAVSYDQRQPVLARFLTGQILGLSGGQLLGGVGADFFGWRAPYVFLAVWFTAAGIALLRMQRQMPAPIVAPRTGGRSLVAQLPRDMRDVLRRPWARVVLVSVFLEGASLFGAVAFLPSHLHRVHGLSLSASALVAMLIGAGGLLFAGLSGRLVRRLGETGLASIGGVLICAAYTTIAIAPVWWLAPPAVVLSGLGFYMFHNTLQTNATQMAPERRGTAVALFASSLFLGQALGVAIAGIVADRWGTAPILAFGGGAMFTIAWTFARLRRERDRPGAP